MNTDDYFDYSAGTPGLGDFLGALEPHQEQGMILPESCARFSSLLWGVSPFVIAGMTITRGFLKFTRDEIIQAQRVVGPKPAIIVNPNCRRESGLHRQIPTLDWNGLATALATRFQVFQFGLSKNSTPVAVGKRLLDLPVRELAALHAIIGRYAGIDSGERHLCHAVGGTAWVIRPRGIEAHYNYAAWEIPSPRFHYYFAEQHQEMLNDILAS